MFGITFCGNDFGSVDALKGWITWHLAHWISNKFRKCKRDNRRELNDVFCSIFGDIEHARGEMVRGAKPQSSLYYYLFYEFKWNCIKFNACVYFWFPLTRSFIHRSYAFGSGEWKNGKTNPRTIRRRDRERKREKTLLFSFGFYSRFCAICTFGWAVRSVKCMHSICIFRRNGNRNSRVSSACFDSRCLHVRYVRYVYGSSKKKNPIDKRAMHLIVACR